MKYFVLGKWEENDLVKWCIFRLHNDHHNMRFWRLSTFCDSANVFVNYLKADHKRFVPSGARAENIWLACC